MSKLASLLVPLTLTAACVQQEEVHPIKDALPTAQQVQVKLPQASAATFALGQLADYYVLTRNTTRDLNGVTAWVLIVVHTIVQYPATSVDGDVYTWGPWSGALDPAEYKLVVTALGDGTYDWQLDGRSKTEPATDFLTVIHGNAEPSVPAGRGKGTFVIDFDAAEAVNPVDNDVDSGVAEFTYDLSPRDGLVATVAIHAEGFGPAGQAAFDYLYNEQGSGAGDFQFGISADLDDDGSAAELAVIRSRWLSDGAGRGDARLSGGDLAEVTVTASECWDTSFRRVYYADSHELAATEGDEAACAFADQDLPAL
jgi:hypothetical protein